MCRWFCYISSSEPQLLQDLLIAPKHSLIKQIDDHYLPSIHISYQPNDTGSPNPQTNMDGFGVGWWTSSEAEFDSTTTTEKDGDDSLMPVIYKSVRPPLNDLNLQSLCRGTKTKGLLAHIRAGTGLTPVVETNNHPFPHPPYLFAHNGTLSHYTSIRLRLLTSLSPPARASILGTTDSEHMCALYFDRLGAAEGGGWQVGRRWEGGVMRRVMREMLAELEGWVAEVREENRVAGVEEDPREHSALNLVVTDGTTLLATRYASPAPIEPPSLYYSTTAGATMNSKFLGHPDQSSPAVGGSEQKNVERQAGEGKEKEEHGRHVIVASEPSTYDAGEWELIRSGGMVWVGRGMEVEVEDI